MAEEKDQISRERKGQSTTYRPEVHGELIRPELELAFEPGDPFQLLYRGIQGVTGDGHGI